MHSQYGQDPASEFKRERAGDWECSLVAECLLTRPSFQSSVLGGKSRRSTVVKLGTVMHTWNLGRQMRQENLMDGLHACALSNPSQFQLITFPLSVGFVNSGHFI